MPDKTYPVLQGPHLTVTQSCRVWRGTSIITLTASWLNVIRITNLLSKSNGFFYGPRATFPPNFVKTGLVFAQYCYKQLNKQTNKQSENNFFWRKK